MVIIPNKIIIFEVIDLKLRNIIQDYRIFNNDSMMQKPRCNGRHTNLW